MEKIITVAASIPAVIRGSELAFDAHKWRDFECYGMIPHPHPPYSCLGYEHDNLRSDLR